jgi:hypothetical protein
VTSEEGLVVCRIILERRLVGDTDRVVTTFENADGDMPPLVEILGMLSFAKLTALRTVARTNPIELEDGT